MSEQTKLEVSIPHTTADGWLDGRFRSTVRGLLRKHGGEQISRFCKEPLCLSIHAVFLDRSTALNAVRAIRTLSPEDASESAKKITYTIDNDEILLIKNEADEFSFESKDYTDALQDWYESGPVESRIVP